MRPLTVVLVTCCLCPLAAAAMEESTTATGVVYLDANENGRRDGWERGIAGVRVSNGRDVVATDGAGRYELQIDDDDIVFVIKPRDHMVPVDENNVPRFSYVHKPAGSPGDLRYPGVEPTGPLPDSIDFGLVSSPEPDSFRVLLFGDPQPRDLQEIDYFAQEVVSELVDADVAMCISLGDIMFDDLDLFPAYDQVMRVVGAPVWNVYGNHDMNFDVTEDHLADETWERTYGPATYSFDYGPVHFIVLDDVYYDGDEKYHCELTDEILEFVENDLAHVPHDQLVVFCQHIPIVEMRNLDRFLELFEDRPHTLSLAAHWHVQRHFFLDSEQGWDGAEPHHHLVHATACGSWWRGATDEFGIPHAMMRCGAPNGYSFITFDGNGYSIRFKPAHRPADEQMHIHVPPVVASRASGSTGVVANVYAGSERSTVEMRVNDGPWRRMELREGVDPFMQEIKALEESPRRPNGRDMPNATTSHHLWHATLPAGLEPGAHVIEVRTPDMFGQRDAMQRVFRVE